MQIHCPGRTPLQQALCFGKYNTDAALTCEGALPDADLMHDILTYVLTCVWQQLSRLCHAMRHGCKCCALFASRQTCLVAVTVAFDSVTKLRLASVKMDNVDLQPYTWAEGQGKL